MGRYKRYRLRQKDEEDQKHNRRRLQYADWGGGAAPGSCWHESKTLYCAPCPEIHFQRLRNTSCDKRKMDFTYSRFLKIFKSLPSCKTTVNVVFVMSHCTSTFEYPRLKFINAKDQSILVARAKSSKVFVAAWKMDFREFIWQCVLFQPRRCHRTFPARNRLWLIWAGPCHGTSN